MCDAGFGDVCEGVGGMKGFDECREAGEILDVDIRIADEVHDGMARLILALAKKVQELEERLAEVENS